MVCVLLAMKLDPDLEPELRDVLEAAAALDTTEFKIFVIAYDHWFGRRAPHELIEQHFTAYMFQDIVPHWVHHFARHVLTLSQQGNLNPDDYGLGKPPPARHMVVIARIYTVVLTVTLVILLLLALHAEDLLVYAKDCYFPPCY